MVNSSKNKKTDDVLRLETARTFDEIDKYADAWNLLALNAPQQHPVLTHAWISAYLKTCVKEGESWFCLFAFYQNDLVGVLPLVVQEDRFLWNKYLLLYTPNDPHTMGTDFLFKENYGQRVIQFFADYLNKMRPRVIRLTMSKVMYNSPVFDMLKDGITGMHSSFFQIDHVSIIPVEGKFDDYKKRLTKNSIRKLKKSRRSLNKTGNFSVNVIQNGESPTENLQSFANIEDSGWKGRLGSTIKKKSWRFFEELVNNMGKKGWLEWYFLQIDNSKIAGYLTIPFGRTSYILKTGYDEKYRFHSPGSILMEEMLEKIYSAGDMEIINLFTDFEWFLRWNVEHKPYYRFYISFNNPVSYFLTRIPSAIYSNFPLFRRLKMSISRLV